MANVRDFLQRFISLSNFKNSQILLVTISKFILNFKLNFSKRWESPYINRRYGYLLASKRLVNKNFSHLIFLFKEITKRLFFGKSKNLFDKVSPFSGKNSFLNSPNLFPVKLPSLKVCKKFLGKSRQKHIQNPVELLHWSFLW